MRRTEYRQDNSGRTRPRNSRRPPTTSRLTVLGAVYPEFNELCGWYAFYPQHLRCFVDKERVGAQPGGYYGGWVTSDLVGPIKGGPGTKGW